MGGKREGGESEIGEFEDGNSGAGGKSRDSGCDLYTLRYLDMAGLKSGKGKCSYSRMKKRHVDTLKEMVLSNLDLSTDAFGKIVAAIRGVFKEKAPPKPARVSVETQRWRDMRSL